jgi:hypothetical protein
VRSLPHHGQLGWAHLRAGKELLSAGQDHALRMFSTIVDEQNCELSQGKSARSLAESELIILRLAVCRRSAESQQETQSIIGPPAPGEHFFLFCR